ncbi:Indolepyruvate oxidoreductase subunit IorB II [hydrothermal vent metagenome]|uniref:Indolepyruvate oxidoreductase subunit IorB II n=1 Tax=hydrothermal vent metagenome TaxID=652676 RepID=A0A3B0RGG1_9ZZZZ
MTTMERPITIAISALGGQGGGVLTNWLVSLAENCGYFAQSTSIPGVAQRTGATIYYLEMFPKTTDDKPPVMALMPMTGDVDLVVAAELMEAGRAVQKHYITPDKTTLITSTHRVYSISEKMALGDGTGNSDMIMEAARKSAKDFIAFDMERLAAEKSCVISSILFGAIAGSGRLPFERKKFEDAIRAEGKMVEANLLGFDAGYTAAQMPEVKETAPAPESLITGAANTNTGKALIERINALPEIARQFAYAGARKLLDFQDIDYAAEYITTLESFAAQDREPCDLTRELARYLALWMAFDDVIKVADIKTRSMRVAKYRAEVRAKADQIVHMTEYMHPRLAEIVGTMPVGLARRVQKSAFLTRFFEKFTGPRLSDTTKISSFLMLYFLASLKSIRRKSLRYAMEHKEIAAWLDRVKRTMATDYDLAVEVIRCQRLIKGYGETHARGMGNFNMIMARIDQGKLTAPGVIEMRTAALADEDGIALKDIMAKAG